MTNLLIFDQDHFNQAGIYQVTDTQGNVYQFRDALDCKDFIDTYTLRPRAAVFTYNFYKRLANVD